MRNGAAKAVYVPWTRVGNVTAARVTSVASATNARRRRPGSRASQRRVIANATSRPATRSTLPQVSRATPKSGARESRTPFTSSSAYQTLKASIAIVGAAASATTAATPIAVTSSAIDVLIAKTARATTVLARRDGSIAARRRPSAQNTYAANGG